MDAWKWEMRAWLDYDIDLMMGSAGSAVIDEGDMAARALALYALRSPGDDPVVDRDDLDAIIAAITNRLGIGGVWADICAERLDPEELKEELLPLVLCGEQVRYARALWALAAQNQTDGPESRRASAALIRISSTLSSAARRNAAGVPPQEDPDPPEPGAQQPSEVGYRVHIGEAWFEVVHDGHGEAEPFLGLRRASGTRAGEPACLTLDDETGLWTVAPPAQPRGSLGARWDNIIWRDHHLIDLTAMPEAAISVYVELIAEGQSSTDAYPAALVLGALRGP